MTNGHKYWKCVKGVGMVPSDTANNAWISARDPEIVRLCAIEVAASRLLDEKASPTAMTESLYKLRAALDS